MIELTPKTNSHLFGHEAAEMQWNADVQSGKLAHGWIISVRASGELTFAT